MIVYAADLRAHMELAVSKGGHSTKCWKTDKDVTIKSKHDFDHKQYPVFLNHTHQKPKPVPTPNAV